MGMHLLNNNGAVNDYLKDRLQYLQHLRICKSQSVQNIGYLDCSPSDMMQKESWLCPYSTGGRRDAADSRDFTRIYGDDKIPSKDKDPKVDLRKYVDRIYDQGELTSCSSNALCSAFSLEWKRQAKEDGVKHVPFNPSRLFVFYNSRVCEGDTSADTGATLRFALLAMNYTGVCKEETWPYDETKFTVQPSVPAYQEGQKNKIVKYERLNQDIHQFRACLKAGFPFAFVMEIYGSFLDLKKNKGVMPIPSQEELQQFSPLLHAVLAVGYDDTKDQIIVLNSWGKKFGDNGYFYMPYAYITTPNRAFDFWKIERVSSNAVTLPHVKKKFLGFNIPGLSTP